MKLYCEMAAKWWGDKLRSCKDERLDVAAVDVFEAKLEKEIKRCLAGKKAFTLMVKDEPDSLLRCVAAKSGVCEAAFPKHTTMWLDGEKIMIREYASSSITFLEYEHEI